MTTLSVADVKAVMKKLQKKFFPLQLEAVGFDPATVLPSQLELCTVGLQELRGKMDDLVDEAMDDLKDDEFTALEPDLDTIMAAMKSSLIKVMEIKRKLGTSIPPSTAFKLERVKLPQFSGDFADWQSFHDLFETAVHLNRSLSGAEKMVHLKSSLTGDAVHIISAFQATEANYDQAWASLKKRYGVKREVIFAHLKRFDDHKGMQLESGHGLRSLADALNECIRSLQVLDVPVDKWDLILIYLSLKKMDPDSRKQWSLDLKSDLPTMAQLLDFLEARARALADSQAPSKATGRSGSEKKKASAHHTGEAETSKPPSSCLKCGEGHPIYLCSSFKNLPVPERTQFVGQRGLCSRCLTKDHRPGSCASNPRWTCRRCNQGHHYLLHKQEAQPQRSNRSSRRTDEPDVNSSTHPSSPPAADVPLASTSSAHCVPDQRSHHVMLLGTLIVTTNDHLGNKENCRVFVDPGSEPNFISEDCVARLGLRRKPTCVTISGVGNAPSQTTKGAVDLTLFSKVRGFNLDIKALILPRVTNPMPAARCQASWSHLQSLDLGDPLFHQPGRIDILLGCDAAASMKIDGLIHGPPGGPVAQNTQFGWLLTGLVGTPTPSHSFHAASYHAACPDDKECLEDSLKRFWELEEPDQEEISLSEEDRRCEAHFTLTHQRNQDGSYTVELPFKQGAPPLGLSRFSAVKRFQRLEARLSLQPQLKADYAKCMAESISAGFMELLPPDHAPNLPGSSYYMPHREVLKESSTSTKVRIVFDASAKSSSGQSLNDVLMTGPKLQIDLVPLLLRFRSHLFAMSADIVKFYPQFRVTPESSDFQRLVWREHPHLPLQDYRMTRVTFGVTSAPFLAIRCLNQLADDERTSLPLAAPVLHRDFLVDNLLSGSSSLDTALLLQDQLLKVMERGKLQLSKWSSNSPQLLAAIPPEHRDSQPSLCIDDTETVKTIGLIWQPKSDSFGVSITTPDWALGSSKRRVLSSIARIFDPLGWLGPVTIRPKILLQELWKIHADWDSPLPLPLHMEWVSYCRELALLTSFRIDRCFLRPPEEDPASRLELHLFCDASQLAYAACAYVRVVDSHGQSRITLVAAKTKVAPVKVETIPRLELCGAVLLTRLLRTIRESMDVTFSTIRCWTDSTIVLDWLASSNKLPIFVSNRVAKIGVVTPFDCWNHVRGEDNPADLATRGISAQSLVSNHLWLHGPSWLSSSTFQDDVVSMATSQEESRLSTLIATCSSYTRMKRVVGYCHRFIHNSKSKRADRVIGPLKATELSQALTSIVRCVQSEAFEEELRRCHRQEKLKTTLKHLTPFLDKDGVLRVGGRLLRSSLPLGKKHPILLPPHHNFSKQLARSYHLAHLHAGPSLLLAVLREEFWIVRGPDIARRTIRACVTCHRQNPATQAQLMGQLPPSRVTPSRPFSHCGLDYAGPFRLSLRSGRNPLIVKSYISLFVCMATKAIHLEWASDLSTPAFIAALTRFLSRRGLPTDIYCDQGLNFQGAKAEMEAFLRFIRSSPHTTDMEDALASRGIHYHLNPPHAPHHGGLWEAGVKSAKHHLKRIMEDRILTIEEFTTLLAQTEAALNSRPLTQMSSDPNDFAVLTPGHFLIGDSLAALPQQDISHLKMPHLSRWQAVQHMFQHFWKRWSSEYLGLLQSRPKWLSNQPDIQIGTLVLVRDDAVQWGPLKWKLARVVAVFPGSDGKTRVVDVKTPTGSIFRRPITKLSPLPIYEST